MKNIEYNEILNRLGFFMNEANLSARATSLDLGYSEQFMKRILNKHVQLKVKTLLDFCEVTGISIFDFFYLGDKFNPEHKECLDLFLKLSDEKKSAIIQIMKTMK